MEIKYKTTYRIGRKISQGGTGKIYYAEKLNVEGNPDGLQYAVKVIEEENKEIAEKEKICCQKVENTSCYSITIPILDSIHWERKEYLVMQLRHQGKFLNELLEEIWCTEEESSCRNIYNAPIPFQHMTGILLAILSSLERLHRCTWNETGNIIGFLHLDLHPGNIFLENVDWKNGIYGTAKFIDFQNSVELGKDGFAKIDENSQPVGWTKEFCPPELEEKNFDNISEQSDLYSVAAIAMYMLTGQYVEGGQYNFDDFFEDEEQILESSDILPVTYSYLKKIMKCGLAYSPQHRFQDAREMRECLLQVLELQKLCQGNDYFTLFQHAYRMGIAGREFHEKQIQFSEHGFINAVRKLKEAMLQTNICIPENRYIFEQLEKLYKGRQKDLMPSVCASLYSSGLAIYNRLADNPKCLQIYGRLLEWKNELHILEWPGIINRAAVSYADTFQMEEALQMVGNNIKNLEKLKEAYLSVAEGLGVSGKSAIILDLGRSYSAYGTYLAYLGKGDPMYYFQKALDEFSLDGSNCAITISHILHYLMGTYDEIYNRKEKIQENNIGLEEKDRIYKQFDYWYCRLTGGRSLEERDEIQIFINEKKGRKDLFGLWIYVKAIYVFHKQEEIPMLQERIIQLVENRDFYSELLHPEALILKYCGLLLYRLKEGKNSEYAYRIFVTATRRLEAMSKKESGELTLYKIMAYHIQSEGMIAMGDDEGAALLYAQFLDRLEDSVFFQLKDWLEEYNKGKRIPKISLKGEYC